MMKPLLSSVLLALTLATAACSGAPDDEPLASDDASEITAASAIVHGTLRVGDQGPADPNKSFADPWVWTDNGNTLVVPAAIDSSHVAHAWDIEVTADCSFSVSTESIRLSKSGDPDVDQIASRFLAPEVYPVADVDTVMVLYKKNGSSWTKVATNDDGMNKGKGSYLERKVKMGSVYRAVIRAKSASTRANLGLFLESRSLEQPFNEDS